MWIVSSEQLLAWVQNPTPISNLNDFAPLKCSTPAVDPSMKICNGIPQNEAGLIELCPFVDFPFYTCYGCPSEHPTPSNPSPEQSTASAAPRARSKCPQSHRAYAVSDHFFRSSVASNCSTPFWDPIKGECICTSSTCAFTDTSRPIGPNGANLTGDQLNTTDEAAPSQSSDLYVPFNGAVGLPAGAATALLVGVVGAFVGAVGAVVRL